MENSSYDIGDVYRDIYAIEDYFYVMDDGEIRVDIAHESILQYCNYKNNSVTYDCNDYFQLTSCGFIYLLKTLKDNYKLEDDKLAEYVILWLSYKLNTVKDKCATNLNEIYTSYIETNNYYNKNIKDGDTTTYKDIIDKKKDLMNMDIKEISKFNGLFSILFYLYYLFHGERLDCQQIWELAKNFADILEELNEDSNNKGKSLHTQILSTLLDDYNNLINKYGNKCSIFQSFPELTPKNKPVESSLQTSEGASSSSSMLNTVIPVLSTFSVISLFLGVAYKYSLFGFGKRSQKQYLREKRKKIKRKEYNYILFDESDYSRNSNNY
ncbi:CIR protein [Plasmodium chabaudi chabaudi]|uniref:CIR protein n=1 Tax=Plasmodium chabaudi chabaudi TaxID=31271 RepID=A0A4V0K4M1_PLACU|nr:CIR protein [Plasmodium chabaudi chabaudi]VTZ67871.1 CIR protein [Plasmodium chabaudi chabaudi]|eukprot:XP_016653501.1 CIR protein [Plasmodium chabaudi chabaudi]